MATNGTHKAHRFDPNFTQNVINATGPKANKRIAKVLPGLIRHLHDFCREEEITVDEWMAAVNFVSLVSGSSTFFKLTSPGQDQRSRSDVGREA